MHSDSRELLNLLPAAVYTTDADGRITYYNQAAADLWGRQPELGELWCGSWRIYKPDGEHLPHEQCPMAIAIREGRAVRGIEAVAERPDGTRVPFMPFPSPIRSANGTLIGAVNLLVDLSDIHAADLVHARLAAIVESSSDAIISKTLEGIVTSWNAGAERIFGYKASEMIGEPILKLIAPELHHEEHGILAALAAGKSIKNYDTVRTAKDGRQIQVSLSVSPIKDRSGRIVGASKIARDITDRKRAEESQQLLMNELNHRVKNTLATVDAMARQSLRRAADPQAFVQSFSGRLQALGRANALLAGANVHGSDVTQGAHIAELISSQLSFGEESDSRIGWSGPVVTLGGQVSLHLALVLHELGTNARKYGALSTASGRVTIEWLVESSDDDRMLTLSWRETDGPEVIAPDKRGFGTTLIEQSFKANGGVATMEFAASGVSCTIKLPLRHELTTRAGADRAEEEAQESSRESNQLRGKRVLVIEDETLIAMVATDFLEALGCEVAGPASTIEAALRLIETEAVDAALLDGNLAGRPVDEIAAALTRKSVPFCFVTGYGREALPLPFRDAVMVEKPFSQTQLLAALGRVLGRTSAGDVAVIPLKGRG